MDEQTKERLKKTYEEEMPKDELIQMALANKDEYEEGVYGLVMDAIKKRGFEDDLNMAREYQNKTENETKWVEIYKYFDEIEKENILALMKDKKIPFVVNEHKRSTYFDVFGRSAGLGMISVPEGKERKAKKILSEYKNPDTDINVQSFEKTDTSKDEKPAPSSTKSQMTSGIIIGLIIGILATIMFNGIKSKYMDLPKSFDDNKDGKPDYWLEYKWGVLTGTKSDSNYDGKPDYWEACVNGEPVSYHCDNDYDGVKDEWGVIKNRRATERNYSFKNDSIVDKKIIYKNIRKDKVVYDRDRDGKFDEWIYYDEFERVIKREKK